MQPVWETSKENVQPIKPGRSLRRLEAALGAAASEQRAPEGLDARVPGHDLDGVHVHLGRDFPSTRSKVEDSLSAKVKRQAKAISGGLNEGSNTTDREQRAPLTATVEKGGVAHARSPGTQRCTSSAGSDLETTIEWWEQRTSRAVEESPADPLAIWIAYIRWRQEAFPSEGPRSQLATVMETALRKFGPATSDPYLEQYIEQYRNDSRYVRLWVQYADLCPDPTEIFLYMRAQNIGQCLALFYEAFASVLEAKHQFAMADRCYAEGIERGAAPLDRLHRRHEEFQARMMRRLERQRRAQQHAGPLRHGDSDAGGTVPVRHTLRGGQQPTGLGGNTAQSTDLPRSALSSLREPDASTRGGQPYSRRSASAEAHANTSAWNEAEGLRRHDSQTGAWEPRGSHVNAASMSERPGRSFVVHADSSQLTEQSTSAASAQLPERPGESGMPTDGLRFPSVAAGKRENQGRIQPWNGVHLIQDNEARSQHQRAMNAALVPHDQRRTLAFTVYVDEDEEEQEEQQQLHTASDARSLPHTFDVAAPSTDPTRSAERRSSSGRSSTGMKHASERAEHTESPFVSGSSRSGAQLHTPLRTENLATSRHVVARSDSVQEPECSVALRNTPISSQPGAQRTGETRAMSLSPPFSPSPSPPSSSASSGQRLNSEQLQVCSPTLHTRQAMADIESMFNEPLHFEFEETRVLREMTKSDPAKATPTAGAWQQVNDSLRSPLIVEADENTPCLATSAPTREAEARVHGSSGAQSRMLDSSFDADASDSDKENCLDGARKTESRSQRPVYPRSSLATGGVLVERCLPSPTDADFIDVEEDFTVDNERAWETADANRSVLESTAEAVAAVDQALVPAMQFQCSLATRPSPGMLREVAESAACSLHAETMRGAKSSEERPQCFPTSDALDNDNASCRQELSIPDNRSFEAAPKSPSSMRPKEALVIGQCLLDADTAPHRSVLPPGHGQSPQAARLEDPATETAAQGASHSPDVLQRSPASTHQQLDAQNLEQVARSRTGSPGALLTSTTTPASPAAESMPLPDSRSPEQHMAALQPPTPPLPSTSSSLSCSAMHQLFQPVLRTPEREAFLCEMEESTSSNASLMNPADLCNAHVPSDAWYLDLTTDSPLGTAATPKETCNATCASHGKGTQSQERSPGSPSSDCIPFLAKDMTVALLDGIGSMPSGSQAVPQPPARAQVESSNADATGALDNMSAESLQADAAVNGTATATGSGTSDTVNEDNTANTTPSSRERAASASLCEDETASSAAASACSNSEADAAQAAYLTDTLRRAAQTHEVPLRHPLWALAGTDQLLCSAPLSPIPEGHEEASSTLSSSLSSPCQHAAAVQEGTASCAASPGLSPLAARSSTGSACSAQSTARQRQANGTIWGTPKAASGNWTSNTESPSVDALHEQHSDTLVLRPFALTFREQEEAWLSEHLQRTKPCDQFVLANTLELEEHTSCNVRITKPQSRSECWYVRSVLSVSNDCTQGHMQSSSAGKSSPAVYYLVERILGTNEEDTKRRRRRISLPACSEKSTRSAARTALERVFFECGPRSSSSSSSSSKASLLFQPMLGAKATNRMLLVLKEQPIGAARWECVVLQRLHEASAASDGCCEDPILTRLPRVETLYEAPDTQSAYTILGQVPPWGTLGDLLDLVRTPGYVERPHPHDVAMTGPLDNNNNSNSNSFYDYNYNYRHGGLDPAFVAFVASELLQLLLFVHRQLIMHWHIRPESLWLVPGDSALAPRILLSDWQHALDLRVLTLLQRGPEAEALAAEAKCRGGWVPRAFRCLAMEQPQQPWAFDVDLAAVGSTLWQLLGHQGPPARLAPMNQTDLVRYLESRSCNELPPSDGVTAWIEPVVGALAGCPSRSSSESVSLCSLIQERFIEPVCSAHWKRICERARSYAWLLMAVRQERTPKRSDDAVVERQRTARATLSAAPSRYRRTSV